jgi:predicted enzyme related to lactoylglutathione lyase
MEYKVDGNVVCGRLKMSGEAAEQMPSTWLCYFAVESTDAALDQVRASGGTVMFGPEDTPYGRMAQCADPAGAAFAIIQLAPDTA